MADNGNNYGYGTVDLTSPIVLNKNRNNYGLGSLFQYDQTPTVAQPDQSKVYANNTMVETPKYDFGNKLPNTDTTPGLWDSVKNMFTPNEKGTSLGGQLVGAVGTTVGGVLSPLASIYYADKNYKMQKEQNDYLKSRDAMADNKIAQVQANYNKTA